MGEERSDRQWQRGTIIGAAEDAAAKVIRTGFGILGAPLLLLPKQSRSYVNNALRELSHGITGMPRNFAKSANAEIDRWYTNEPDPASVVKAVPAPVVKAALAPVPVVKAAPAPVVKPTPAPVPVVVPPPPPVAKVAPPPPPVAKPPVAVAAVTTGVEIAHIEHDTPDREVDGEYVLIWNTNDVPVDLTGWTLNSNESKSIFTFPAFTLAPGAEVTLWTKRGKNDEDHIYWNSRKAVWNNNGDTGTLKDANGATINVYTYTRKKI